MIAARLPQPGAERGRGAPVLLPASASSPRVLPGVRKRRGSLTAAFGIVSRLRALEAAKLPLPQRAPVCVVPFEEARARSLQASLHAVGHVLGRPALVVLLVACAGAVALHVAFASWSLAQRPHKARSERIAMAVAAAEEPLLDEPELEPEVVEPPPSQATASSAQPSAPSLVPSLGPIIPGIAPVGPGGGNGMQVGGDGPSAPSTQAAPPTKAEPRIEPARARSRPAPAYPRRARDQGVEGRVVLQLLIDDTGAVKDVRVLESEPAGVFDEAAIAAVRRWTFAPGTSDGKATSSWVRQVVRFSLDTAPGAGP